MSLAGKWIKKVLDPALGRVFPAYCEICEQRTREEVTVCADCQSHFQRQSPPHCLNCAEKVHPSELLGEVCQHCKTYHFVFEFAVTAYIMNAHLRHCIHVFKYQSGLYMTEFLVSCLREGFEDERILALDPAEWGIVSVPVHHIRERERRFDQGMVLAKGVAELTDFTYYDLLKRTRHTPHQAHLNKKERRKNIEDSFGVKEGRAHPENILLIDDVFTTGATTNACAKVLKKAGVKQVIVICLARR